VDGSRLPVVDAPAELGALARTIPFPLRVPRVPDGWRANNVDQDRVGPDGPRAVRVGYLTAGANYLRLVQSDADEAALLATETGSEPVPGTGVQEVAGLRWVVYAREGREPVWVAELPGPTPTRALITGSGTEEEFTALATAVATAATA
jgi:hypothetical protein